MYSYIHTYIHTCLQHIICSMCIACMYTPHTEQRSKLVPCRAAVLTTIHNILASRKTRASLLAYAVYKASFTKGSTAKIYTYTPIL